VNTLSPGAGPVNDRGAAGPIDTAEAAEHSRDEWLEAGRECLEAALRYAGLGWSALCLCPPDHVGVRKHRCDNPGKVPLCPWKVYQDQRADVKQLHRWWHGWPNANVGMALGPVSGLAGVDVDGEDGERDLAEASRGDLPPTLEFTSGKGRRLLYALPPGVALRTTHQGREAKRPLSLLAKGSQTVMPPSRHASGRRYGWVAGRGPGEIEIAKAPAWLLAALRPAGGNGRRRAQVLAAGEVIPEGSRNGTLTSLGGTMRRRGFSERAIAAALLVVNEEQCDPPLPEGVVKEIARSLARYEPGKLPIPRPPRRRRGHRLTVIRATVEVY
jgi:hypothetical protein